MNTMSSGTSRHRYRFLCRYNGSEESVAFTWGTHMTTTHAVVSTAGNRTAFPFDNHGLAFYTISENLSTKIPELRRSTIPQQPDVVVPPRNRAALQNITGEACESGLSIHIRNRVEWYCAIVKSARAREWVVRSLASRAHASVQDDRNRGTSAYSSRAPHRAHFFSESRLRVQIISARFVAVQ
jgi:hypothetical protein